VALIIVYLGILEHYRNHNLNKFIIIGKMQAVHSHNMDTSLAFVERKNRIGSKAFHNNTNKITNVHIATCTILPPPRQCGPRVVLRTRRFLHNITHIMWRWPVIYKHIPKTIPLLAQKYRFSDNPLGSVVGRNV